MNAIKTKALVQAMNESHGEKRQWESCNPLVSYSYWRLTDRRNRTFFLAVIELEYVGTRVHGWISVPGEETSHLITRHHQNGSIYPSDVDTKWAALGLEIAEDAP